MRMDSFGDVIRAVASHVEASGHQDIRMVEESRWLTGCRCHECNAPWAWWMAPISTIADLPKALRAKSRKARRDLIVSVVKKALEPRPYRPTAWERLNMHRF